jgi:hypothetical protein
VQAIQLVVPIRGCNTHAAIAIDACGLHLPRWVLGLRKLSLFRCIIRHVLYRFLP